jgi:hypothetical protein
MADNFDLKKFLKESKALENLNPMLKSLNENESRKERADVDKYEYEKGKKAGKNEEIKAQIRERILAELTGDIEDDPDAKLNADYDPVYEGNPEDEDEDNYDYSNDFYDGDPNDDGDPNNFGDTDKYVDFDGFGEAKKKDEEVEDVETTDVETTDTTEEVPAEEAPAAGGGLEDVAADMEGTEGDLMDSLMKAFKIAKGMGNEKLETQVGNTLKFFVSEYIGGGEQ